MTKKQLENQIKEDFWNRYRTFTGRLATALSQVDPNNLLISKTIIWDKHVISARTATSSVHAQSRDQCMRAT